MSKKTNRISIIKEYIENYLKNSSDIKSAHIHLYSVAQHSAFLALKRKANPELATIIGLLHDIYSYKFQPDENHGAKGAIIAKNILVELQIVDVVEREIIVEAIALHSQKEKISNNQYAEILKDGDVLSHILNDVSRPVLMNEKDRFEKIKKEFLYKNKQHFAYI